MPTEQWLRGRVTAVQGSRALKRRLMAERGLTAATALQFEVGWDEKREVWTLPIRDSWGQLVNVSYRPPRGSGRNPSRIRGRTAPRGGLPLYPDLPEGDAWILTAGEWDALAARQAGLPQALTGLCGCLWHRAWNPCAVGKRIAVVYDVGEEFAASVTVTRLRLAGAEAWPVYLPSTESGYDLDRWFREGRTSDELIALIRRSK